MSLGSLGSASSSGITHVTWTDFTPTVTLVGGAGNTVPEYSTNEGRYCRIGNTCFVDVYLAGDGGDEGAGTGQINIALPLTASPDALSKYFPCGALINNAVIYAAMLYGEISSSATTIKLSSKADGSSATGNDQSDSSRSIRLNFSYEV